MWSIVNHFIPYTEEELGVNDRFEGNFLSSYTKDKNYSEEAKVVLEEDKKICQAYSAISFSHHIREKFKLERSNVGYYQIRQSLKMLTKIGDLAKPFDFSSFEEAYAVLTEKCISQVYKAGFLKK